MNRIALTLFVVFAAACGSTSDGGDRSGAGGAGGAAPPPQSVDQTCRDWCANESEGLSCHQGPIDSVQPCYENCLGTYQQQVERQCGDEWIAVKGCQFDLECADLFGDCDPLEDEFLACGRFTEADSYCASQCENQDRQECVQQYLATGTCGAPRGSNWVYCDNPEVAAPSCSLDGYSMADDSTLRLKLEGCASSTCHGGGALSANTWALDLSGSVEDGLSALNHFADDSPFFLVDDLDPDCSQMLADVSTRPVGPVRMPVTGGFWSTDEVDCFRSYLHEMSN